jgi:hypothetical protein
MAATADGREIIENWDEGYQGVAAFTVAGAAVSPGRAVAVNCTVAGNVTFTFADGSSLQVPVATGLTILRFAVTGASAATATATYAVLK